MQTASDQKDALALLGLTTAGFLVLVISTTSSDYGIILMKGDRWVWTVTRMLPALAWFSIAGVLILFRDSVAWQSAATAFLITLIVGSAVAVAGAPVGGDSVSIMTTVCYYSIISAFLCLTLRSAIAAALFAPLMLAAQVALDIAAHLATGVLQFGL